MSHSVQDLFTTFSSSSSSMSDSASPVPDSSSNSAKSHSGVIGRDYSAIDPHLSPSGALVAFVIAGDIYVVDAAANTPNETVRRITYDGGKNGVFNGLADFIAQEEMDRYRGYWWRPDG